MSGLESSIAQPSTNALAREGQLYSALGEGLWTDAKNYAKEHTTTVAAEAAGAAVLGAGFAALTKNPELLGEALAPAIKTVLPWAGRAGLAAAGIDWGMKLGAPGVDVWINPDHLQYDQQQLNRNVAQGIVDYGAMGAGGMMGAGAALWKVPEAPSYKPGPSSGSFELPRTYANPETVTTQRESVISDDVRNLYESSFPIEERQPTDEVQALIDKGRIRLDTTRDAEGNAKAYSFVSIHDENPKYQFAHLDFVATDAADRSQGIGTLHLNRLNATLKGENPNYVAMTLEMEDPKQPGLSSEEVDMRNFRSKFYQRQGAVNTLPGHTAADGEYMPGYKILDFDKIADPATWTAADDNQPAEWRAFVYKPEKYDPLRAALTFYRDEGGYGVENNHPAVTEMLRLHGKDMKWLNAMDRGRPTAPEIAAQAAKPAIAGSGAISLEQHLTQKTS